MYNAPMNEFSNAPESQNMIPRPMSMQSQFSQQLSVGDVSEQRELLRPAQPSLGTFKEVFRKIINWASIDRAH